MADSGSGSGRREGRSITQLSRLIVECIAKERTQVEVNPRSSKVSGPNAANFRSYLGVLARRHVSIIIPSWDDVEEADKNLMWQDIQASKNDAPHLLSGGYELEGLVEQTTQDSFVPHGRDDILTTAIRRPKHAGRVCGIGGSWSHRDYFGAPPSRSSTVDSCSQEAMQRMEMQFEEKLKNPNQCELYVEDDPPCLVAIGRVFEGGSTIHGVPLELDWTRVVVDQVQDVVAPVPLPNTEVQLVGQATDIFLAWPKRLVMPLSARAKVLLLLFYILIIILLLNWNIRVFGVDSSNVPLYISLPDALEIVGGNSILNISIIQLWAMYMDKLSVEQAQAQVYGFIEPQSIQKSGNTQVQIQQYMQTWMSESGRDIYMAPYIDGSHWQLMVIIPKEYTVVWFCSLHRKPSHEIKCQLQG
uniref:DUF8039 domain-containing protein n=1 Tax=Cajanus cajan TaxID=3821 RepID=A0A151R7T7_CAJCA|nr:hypothetical protein KK1_040175 [Cajanus cajan]